MNIMYTEKDPRMSADDGRGRLRTLAAAYSSSDFQVSRHIIISALRDTLIYDDYSSNYYDYTL